MNAMLREPLSERFREPDTIYLSPTRMAEFFGFQIQDLAERAHVHRNTVRVRPHSPQVQSYLRDLVRVLSAAVELTGDPARAAFLIRNEPLRVFDRKTADTLVQEGRADDVVGYLESIAGGAAG